MIRAVVSFEIAEELEKNTVEKKFRESAPMYKDVNGLIRKNYLIDIEHNKAGGSILLIQLKMRELGLVKNR